MAQFDKIHNSVKNALIKDGWTITAENFQFRFKELKLYGDIDARKIFAERGLERIVVEVKSFISVSRISEFEKALGQYRIYKRILQRLMPEAKVYLAISEAIYKSFFSGEGIQIILKEEEVTYFVVDLKNEVIVLWEN